MAKVTIPKNKYEQLRQKAKLYDDVFRNTADRVFGGERYTDKRIDEFKREDRVGRKVKEKAKRLLDE